MAVSDSAKVDLLYKKLFGVTKTDLPANKSPSNESIASPSLLRGDTVWAQADQIPGTAATTANIVQSYQTTSRIECVADTTSSPISSVYPTWKTNLTDWIPPEFGSSYFVKVYAETTGNSNPTTGTPLSDAGIGGVGEWNFDYQAGVLNFIGGTIPSALTSSKVIYITGYRYIGAKGLGTAASANIGNITINDTTISVSTTNGNLNLSGNGNGLVVFSGTSAVQLPTGNTAQEPGNASEGALRYNTEVESIEFFTGNSWVSTTSTITTQSISPDGINDTFTLDKSSVTEGIIVNLNGVMQQPYTAYDVTGNQITFTQVPQTTDIVEIRFITAGVAAQSTGSLALISNVAPASSSSSGTKGQVAYDNSYLYICVDTNTWIRSAISTSF